jgi:predicted alpha/beta-fold hydrolase
MEDYLNSLDNNQLTIGMVDNKLIAPLFGYENGQDYYRKAACIN